VLYCETGLAALYRSIFLVSRFVDFSRSVHGF
jgi:hypothetical protein